MIDSVLSIKELIQCSGDESEERFPGESFIQADSSEHMDILPVLCSSRSLSGILSVNVRYCLLSIQ